MLAIEQVALWSNTYGGLVSAASVLIAVVIFLITLLLQRNRRIRGQIGILKSLMCELNYLGGQGEMNVAGRARRSHLYWYEKSFKTGSIPTHDMKDINVNTYITELDEEVKGKSTRDLKNIVLWIHDCVIMVNRWTGEFLKLHSADYPSQIKAQEVKKMLPFVKHPIDRLKELIPVATKEIDTKWLN